MAGMFDLNGSHVLVTGASSGLGQHFAEFLAGLGARVTVAARRKLRWPCTVDAIRQKSGQAESVVMDVTNADSIEGALDRAEAAFGPVTVLINNAGVTLTRAAIDIDEDGWTQVIDTNLKGAWLAAQRSARRMVRDGVAGSIVNIASILGARRQAASHPTQYQRPASFR